jgi:hypothetical protein
MTRGRAAKRGRGKGKSKGRGRRWLTALLMTLLGFFVLSIVLGRLQASSREAAGQAAQPVALTRTETRIVPDADSPTLVVWNGSGRDGLAGRAAGWLRGQGFDVFETGNADRSDYKETLVVQRSGRTEAGKKVAARVQERLGVGFLITQRADVPEADVLLILGEDFPDSLPMY